MSCSTVRATSPGDTYSYNAAGNLSAKEGVTLGYGDSNHPHAVTSGGGTYGYDANGNMDSRTAGGQNYSLVYNAEGRLTGVGGDYIAAFEYDGDGKRVKQVLDSTTTYFVGNYYEKTGSTITKYYYAGATRIAMRAGGTLSYLLGDHLGSTSVVTDASGVLLMETRYKPFGEVRYATAGQTLPTRYTFTGQYSYVSDEATDAAGFGLMYFNARWMDTGLGRFAQADTMIPSASDPQAWDRYAFVNNNPLRYTDPSGHCAICVGLAVLGGIGVGWLSGHLLGLIPDYRGVQIAKSIVPGGNAIVGASIAVQSEYYGPWDTRAHAPNGEHSGLGYAQVNDAEMQALAQYDPTLQGGDQEDPSVAVQAMATRIDRAVNGCGKCTDDTDRFIVAALAQNGTGFGVKAVQDLPVVGGRINWDHVMLQSGNRTSDPIALARQTATGMSYSTQLMLKLYTHDIELLQNEGFTLPDGYSNVNWEEIYRLIYLEDN